MSMITRDKMSLSNMVDTYGIATVLDELHIITSAKAVEWEKTRKSSKAHNFWAGFAYGIKKAYNYEIEGFEE